MKSTVETLSPTRVRLAIEVPFDEMRPSIDKAYRSIARQVRVPGFRPGKAPARIIDQRIGRDAVLEQAVQDAIPRAYSEAVTANNVRIIGQPDVEVTKIEDGQSVSFTIEVDVRPEMALPDLQSLEITVDEAATTDDDLNEEIEGLRQRFATLKNVDRPAQRGDYISLDLAATVDGIELEGANVTGLSYEVGSEELLPGLDDALVGLSASESKQFETGLVSGEHAGKVANVTATVRSVREQELPELDDEFAQTASEFDTLSELRDDARKRVEDVKRRRQYIQARERIVEALLAATEIPLPESVVQEEAEARRESIQRQLNSVGVSMDSYLEQQGQTQEDIEADIQKATEEGVKTRLLLDMVADTRDTQLSDAELAQHIALEAIRRGVDPSQFAQQAVKSGRLSLFAADARRSKALDELVEAVPVKDATGASVDMAELRRSIQPSRPADRAEGSDSDEVTSEDGDLGPGA